MDHYVKADELQPIVRRVERILGNPGLFGVVGLGALVAAICFAFWLKPEPHSDWLSYWRAAGDVDAYTRGGIGLWLLAVPKGFGLPPYAAALVMNLTSAACMLWMAWRSDPTAAKWFAWLVAAYMLLITPYFGIVQLDLFAATMIAAGFVLTLPAHGRNGGARHWLIAIVCILIGVSTRTQYALILGVMWVLLMTLRWLPPARTWPGVNMLMAVLLTGAFAGFAVDSGLRALGGNSDAVRTGTAVTLYTGLLASGDGAGCGYWSVEASQAAKADLHKPLYRAALDRLAEKPAAHWLSVGSCKLPHIISPSAYAVYWLIESPNVRARMDAHPQSDKLQARYARVLHHENKIHGVLTMLILMVVVAVGIGLWRLGSWLPGWLPFVWVLAFCVIHAVFEIQGRYFLGMLLLAPLLSALALRIARTDTTRTDSLPVSG